MIENKEKETLRKAKRTYDENDLLQFENTTAYSGIGRQWNSRRETAPTYGFGSVDREKRKTVYDSEQQMKQDKKGKVSPGPRYNTSGTDSFRFNRAPTWHQGTQERNTLETGPKQEHYLRKDVDYNPHEADLQRKFRYQQTRIGLEPRFPLAPQRNRGGPGPQYNPNLKQEIPNSQKYTFGYRRDLKRRDFLMTHTQTSDIVGPSSYFSNGVPRDSTIENEPHYSIGKSPRFDGYKFGYDKNQTFDTRTKSIGTQINSKKTTFPSFSIMRTERDETKRANFQNTMTTFPKSVNIQMPVF